MDRLQCAGKKSPFLANGGEVETPAVLTVADKTGSAGTRFVVQTHAIVRNHFGDRVNVVNILFCRPHRNTKRAAQFLRRFFALFNVVGFVPRLQRKPSGTRRRRIFVNADAYFPHCLAALHSRHICAVHAFQGKPDVRVACGGQIVHVFELTAVKRHINSCVVIFPFDNVTVISQHLTRCF